MHSRKTMISPTLPTVVFNPTAMFNPLAGKSLDSTLNRDLPNRRIYSTQPPKSHEKNTNTVCELMNDTDNNIVYSNEYGIKHQDLYSLPNDNDIKIVQTEIFNKESVNPRQYSCLRCNYKSSKRSNIACKVCVL